MDLEATITTQGNFERVVEVDIEEHELAPHFDKAYKKYQKGLKLEGFRKGKVPLGLIKKLYGDALKREAIEEVVGSVFQEVSTKENLHPVAPAKLQDVNYEPSKGLHFRATIEVLPDIELTNYLNLPVEQELYQVDEEDTAAALEDVRERMAVMEPIEGEAETGHFIVADFQQVDSNGFPIIGKKYEDRLIELKQDDNPELTDQLIGVRVGDARRVDITTHDSQSRQEKKEHYEVKVKEIKSKQLPELDDDLAKDVGKFETLDELKADIIARLIKRTEIDARGKLRQNLIDEVLKRNAFDLPESMVTNYLDKIVEGAKKEADEEESLRQQYRPIAVWNLKWELVKSKLEELEKIVVTDEDKEKLMARIAEDRGVKLQDVKASLTTKTQKERFNNDVLENKVIDFLEKKAKIKEKKITRKDIEKARRLVVS